MKNYQRVFMLVLDSLGIGAAKDAADYGDVGANTLKSLMDAYEGKLNIPHLSKLGLGNFYPEGITEPAVFEPLPSYLGVGEPVSHGKDSIDGHWEMMGLITPELDYFPQGFPEELLEKLEAYSGRGILGNKAASGTKIIEELGEEQLKTGDLIVYTSGDSVFQIAAHEEVVPLEELYDICRFVRKEMNGPEYVIGRVIARPYVGTHKGNFTRTDHRKDFSIEPTGETALDLLQAAGLTTIAIGKIQDLFSGQGITEAYHNKDNMDGMDHVDHVMKQNFTGFCFVNLVDFDSLYGHRRDPIGFGQALMEFDERLGSVLEAMTDEDLLIITADHGNDPGFTGSDHTRENVPIIVYSPAFVEGGSLGVRSSLADMGASVLDNFAVSNELLGESFFSELK